MLLDGNEALVKSDTIRRLTASQIAELEGDGVKVTVSEEGVSVFFLRNQMKTTKAKKSQLGRR